ncbi:hypothetical protein [Bdellovibrio bacteriovorus]|uniref:hypothetical protein n=1 Tax=Bdellovibrio bacteriovorus TaxID=959 RepID=UPI0035A61BDF
MSAGNNPSVIRSFAEDVEMFLGDCLSSQDLAYSVATGLLSESEANTLSPFYNAFNAFAEDAIKLGLKEEEILVDPRWGEITRLAGEASRLLDASLRS